MSYKSKKCIICHKQFTPNNGVHKCCSKECLKKHNQECGKLYSLKHKKEKQHIICPTCNKKFIANHSRQKYCCKECRENNLNNKLIHILRNRILGALKNNSKSTHTKEFIGCTIEELWLYLEKQFKQGMTKENHGRIWHLDHIVPCSSFDLSKEKEQKKCFHYTNLQPLFAEENIKKGCKVL